MVYKSGQIFLPFCHNSRVWQTDRQTDRRTDRILIARPRLHSMQRGKNGSFYRATACNATHGIAKAFLSVRLSNACFVTKRKKLMPIFLYSVGSIYITDIYHLYISDIFVRKYRIFSIFSI